MSESSHASGTTSSSSPSSSVSSISSPSPSTSASISIPAAHRKPHPTSSDASSSTPSSSSSSLPDSSSSSSSSDSQQTLTIGLSVGIIGLLLVIGILFFTKRLKRRSHSGTAILPGSNLPSHRATLMGFDHPAAKITPFGSAAHGVFGSGADVPGYAFGHEPGQNMRIAIRRPDGAWDFKDSRTMPFDPAGVNDLDVVPSSSAASFVSYSSMSPLSAGSIRGGKEEEARRYKERGRKEFGFDTGPETLVMPPPAYGASL